jgi:ABC-type nitrate/sulfonate/bicarbonate transport system permease component
MIHVMLPSALPYIVTGLRVSSAVALILSVTAEVVIGAPGLGREINLSRSAGDNTAMYAFIIAIGLMGWTLNILTNLIERRALHWHVSQRMQQHD